MSSSSSHHHRFGYTIPTDILLKIFSLLDFPRKVNIAQVCRSWRNIIYNDVTRTTTNVKVSMRDMNERCTKAMIPSLIQRNISGLTLNLSDCGYAKWRHGSITTLNKFLSKMVTLRSIKVLQAYEETDRRLEASMKQFRFHHASNLTRIHLRWNEIYDNMARKMQFVLCCSNLEILILESCHCDVLPFDDQRCDKLMREVNERLKKLRYLEIPAQGLTSTGMERISYGYDAKHRTITGNIQLEVLILQSCTGIFIDNALLPASAGLKSLRLLEISENSRITNDGVAYLGKMKSLQELILKDCHRVSDECVKLLDEAGSQIQRFAATYSFKPTFGDKALEYFAQSQMPLKELRMCNWKVSDHGIRQLGESRKEIESLTMRRISSITDSALEIIVEKFSSLKHINLIQTRVTSNAMQKLRERFNGQLNVMSDRRAIQSVVKSKYLK